MYELQHLRLCAGINPGTERGPSALGYRDGDSGHILENIIYFELLRQGYDVAIGKIGNQGVNFIATKADEKKYIQVTENMNVSETRERELAPLFPNGMKCVYNLCTSALLA